MIGILLGVTGILLGTWLGFPTLAPVLVGLAMGVTVPMAARRAALAGVIAWGGVLLAATLRGDNIAGVSRTLGGAMGVPSWLLLIVTLLYPAILAASAAWLASLAARRFSPWSGGHATLSRGLPPT
ncbi:MAG TPA: hypothetical protein VFD64_02960 [Gemmatimonadaceae bacterium]|nr:hypothetical protein [Gemmatimonadaceae bacterium]